MYSDYAVSTQGSSFNSMPFVLIISVLATIAALILLYKFVMPENKCKKYNKFVQWLHNVFNFKQLFVEAILKSMYVISTVFCVIFGVLCIFGVYHYSGYYGSATTWYGGYGILIAIAGPIAIRILYEIFMMFILLVKNVIEINKKLKNSEDGQDKE